MRLEVLCGMIASGKSTYARQRARQGALVVCHDDLTAMLHAEYRYEQGLREMYRRMEEALVIEAMDAGRDVIIDRTHLTRESRVRWTSLALDPSDRKVAIAFPVLTAEEHAMRRFEGDPRGRSYEDWLEVARHHHAQAMAEPLSGDEGFDEIIQPHPGRSYSGKLSFTGD